MSKVSKRIQWIPDDYVFGSTLESLFNPQHVIRCTKSLEDEKNFAFLRSRSKSKLPIIKHLQRIYPDTTCIRAKLAVLNQRYSKEKLPLAPVIEAPRKKFIKRDKKTIEILNI